ncbi:PspA/IM30 family protein [Clostridium sp. CS001]|uniref:PspA/IM30 family protein n=1 Tax=Clostridium sp. CS001 TaxID=2880648 RepID=UPI001CF503C5|nr:PspA/IM30 family protein [Clostridium sp. CS001]MCB2291233.1 PspA/IM30 family protein [Clostridium sp. CS001]
MTLLTRILYILKSKINSTLDELENPLELLDQKIRDMECTLNEAKFSSAKVLGSTHEIERRIESLSTESATYVETIKLALSKGDETLAKKILQKKLDNDKYCISLNSSYTNSTAKAHSLKLKLRELEQNIYETKIYRNEAIARYTAAEADKKINEILGNISTKNNAMPLSDIERIIEKKECYVSGLTDLNFANELSNELDGITRLDLSLELKKYM